MCLGGHSWCLLHCLAWQPAGEPPCSPALALASLTLRTPCPLTSCLPTLQMRGELGHGNRGTPAQLAGTVTDAQAGWSRWAVGVHWLVLAAEAVGLRSLGE